MSWGAWRTDSVPYPVVQAAERVRGGDRVSADDMTYRRSYERSVTGTSDTDVMTQLYGGSIASTGPYDGYQFIQAQDFGGGVAQGLAQQTWLTLHRPGDVWVYDGVLPGDPDPRAIDIEWEPTATPATLKMQVYLIRIGDASSTPEYNPSVPAGVTMHVKLFTDLAGTYDAGGFVSNPGVYSDAATFPAASHPFTIQLDPTHFDLEFDAPVPSTGEMWMAGTVVDDYWNSLATPAVDPMSGLLDFSYRAPFQLMLVGYYKPRYRYLYPSAPPRLIYPRQQEGRRIYPPPNTQQFGRRTGSSSPL